MDVYFKIGQHLMAVSDYATAIKAFKLMLRVAWIAND